MKVVTPRWTKVQGWSEPLPSLDGPKTLVIVFGDRVVEERMEPLDDLVAAYPNSVIVGCSTAGQITHTDLRDESCSAAITSFEKVQLRSTFAEVTATANSTTVGRTIGDELAGSDLRAVFVLSDGLAVNGSELVAGLVASVGPDVVITGGLAGDGDRFERTWVFDGGARHHDRVVAVGFYGDAIRVHSGSQGGWGIFGPERIVTRSVGNVLYELDGKPALEIYKNYLGDLAAELPASALLFPLAIRTGDAEEQLVRTVLAVNEDDQSMTFAGDVPQGCRAQLMRSSADRLVDGAASAATLCTPEVEAAGPTLAIAISCVGRRLVLGERTEEEIEAILDELPADTALIGFYSYGEIAPGVSGKCDLHNQTMTITTFTED